MLTALRGAGVAFALFWDALNWFTNSSKSSKFELEDGFVGADAGVVAVAAGGVAWWTGLCWIEVVGWVAIGLEWTGFILLLVVVDVVALFAGVGVEYLFKRFTALSTISEIQI